VALSGLPRQAVRRWYVTLFGLLVTAGLCLVAGKAVPATYQAKADVLVMAASKSVGPGGNPYLDLSGLQQAAEVLGRAMSDTTAADRVQRAGGSTSYSVLLDPRSSAPLLLITGSGRTPAIALQTLHQVIDLAGPTMTALQRAINVPTVYQITTKLITADQKASPVRKSQIRAVIAAGAVGVLLTLAAVAMASAFFERRTARKRAKAAAARTLAEESTTELDDSFIDETDDLDEVSSLDFDPNETASVVGARSSARAHTD
jgi:hypothetical protein